MSAQLPITDAPPLAETAVFSPPEARTASRISAWWRNVLQAVLLLATGIGSYLLVGTYFLKSVQVVGASMQPTLRHSDRCLLNRWILWVRAPGRGDIVVLRDPADNGYSVKRVVGIEGDSIYLRGGDLVVNGQVVKESYLPQGTPTYPNPKLREQRITCGKGEFLVLGDNRSNSVDSRHYGPVPRRNILGLIVR